MKALRPRLPVAQRFAQWFLGLLGLRRARPPRSPSAARRRPPRLDAVHYGIRSGSSNYQYVRRVPLSLSHLDKRTHIRVSLRTPHADEAAAMSAEIDASVEALWAALLSGRNAKAAWAQHRREVARAKTMIYGIRTAKRQKT